MTLLVKIQLFKIDKRQSSFHHYFILSKVNLQDLAQATLTFGKRGKDVLSHRLKYFLDAQMMHKDVISPFVPEWSVITTQAEEDAIQEDKRKGIHDSCQLNDEGSEDIDAEEEYDYVDDNEDVTILYCKLRNKK